MPENTLYAVPNCAPAFAQVSGEIPRVNLRTKEAADFLGVKPNTLNHWVSARKIPHYKVSGRCVLFDVKDLEIFLASKKIEAVE